MEPARAASSGPGAQSMGHRPRTVFELQAPEQPGRGRRHVLHALKGSSRYPMSFNIRQLLAVAPVIPVIRIEKLEHAVPMAQALVAGGLRVLEVTLRTPVALSAIERIRASVPDAIVGAGTLQRPADFKSAAAAGAQFAVTPGLTAALVEAAREVD